ncbi:MAG TPA: 50S ribosomal protein L11 methyltransferase [candidate division Zixibacteria bacterium]|nr:50S ribosomal protein L11 methyltransferase [candidate division Zixibacteria bacterium]
MKKPQTVVTKFTEATVFVPRAMADAVSSYVTDNIVSGIILDDSENVSMIGIKFYVPKSEKDDFRPGLKKYLSQIVSIEMPETPKIIESTIASQDWESSYKKSIKPVLVANDTCVRPPWTKKPRGIVHDIVIEPKMAFGTGNHETTRACLRFIHEHFQKGWRFLDFGCGSGVLSILAGKLGAGFIKAVDYDIIAVDNTKENLKSNGVKTKSEILFGSFEKTVKDAPYDMVCANLQKKDLVENFAQLTKLTKSGGYLILSGILEYEKEDIDLQIRKAHLELVDFVHENEWLSYCLKK